MAFTIRRENIFFFNLFDAVDPLKLTPTNMLELEIFLPQDAITLEFACIFRDIES